MNTEENDTEAELAAWELLREARLELTAARAEIEAIMETLKSPIEVELDMIRGKIAIPDRSELDYITQLKAVTEQRDRLAVALKELLTTGDNGYGTPTDKAWEMAEQAIAAVKGGSDE
jgi:hypothetical protein